MEPVYVCGVVNLNKDKKRTRWNEGVKENEWATDGMKIADQTCLLWAQLPPIHTLHFFFLSPF